MNLSAPAQKEWEKIPKEVRVRLLNNVYCGNCRGVTGISHVSGRVVRGDLILEGQCTACRHFAARVIETSELASHVGRPQDGEFDESSGGAPAKLRENDDVDEVDVDEEDEGASEGLRVAPRSVWIIHFKAPMAEWLSSIEEQQGEEKASRVTLQDLNREPVVYLTPELDSVAESQEFLGELWEDLFEILLGEWYTDPDLWPEPRTRAMFDQWFQVTLHPLVFDLVGDRKMGL